MAERFIFNHLEVEGQEMSDSQFVKIFSGMIGALVVLTVVLIVAANVIGGAAKQQLSEADYDKAVAERIKPIGEVKVASSNVMDALVGSAQAADGKATYDATCFACHGTGVAGSPKLGDKAAWKDRIAQGAETLHKHAIEGFQGKTGVMPAKGGNASLSDDDVKAAVDYMVSESQ
jgi:cytochrome c5